MLMQTCRVIETMDAAPWGGSDRGCDGGDGSGRGAVAAGASVNPHSRLCDRIAVLERSEHQMHEEVLHRMSSLRDATAHATAHLSEGQDQIREAQEAAAADLCQLKEIGQRSFTVLSWMV